nr:hypothetical protein [Tanacetum cinerariifolium]GEY33044.1 hypothetical protein [Tanacetum cinerariifolium]
MHRQQAQQVAHDVKLVLTEDRVKIGKGNLRMNPTLTQKEETYQVILDIIKNTPCYNTFLVSADVPEIDMYPRVLNQEFIVPPSNDSLFDFLLELGYKGQLKHILKCLLITCINYGLPLELSSTDAYQGRRQAMTDSDYQELKFYRAIKDEKIEDILWVSTDEYESDDEDKEDDESINIEKIKDERTESDNDDHEMLDAVKTDVAKEHEENAKIVEEQKADEELKADEEQQEDDQARDE